MKLDCLIVDDEPIAQQILEKYIAQIDALNLVDVCNNAFKALNILHSEKINILFLDIKMPILSGLDMLKTIQKPPKVILTTAFAEYGVESYEYAITDYLLKPITFERFLKAVNKILIPKESDLPSEKLQERNISNEEFIFFKADKKIHKFYYNEILFFEGSGNYVKIYVDNNPPLLVLEKLSRLEEKLHHQQFVRVHKSYIINFTKIRQLEGNTIKIMEYELPIGQSYRDNLLEKINII